MEDAEARLIAEQLGRMADMFNARLATVEESLRHHTELDGSTFTALREDVGRLVKTAEDHETRLRTVTDGVTCFKVMLGLLTGGSSFFLLSPL